MQLSADTIHHLQQIQAVLDQLNPDAEPQALLAPDSVQPRATIIVCPGSFNPPTNAHIALLQQARLFAQKQGATSLYAAISKRIVDKEKVERPTLLDRIELLDTVLHRYLQDAGIMLFNRGLYVEQAQAVRSSFPQVEHLFFLLGFDKIVQIFDSHYYEDRDASLVALFAIAELLVAPRGNDGEQELEQLLHHPENERFAHFVHPLPFDAQYRNISSTQIRLGDEAALLAVPPEVQQFIRESHAYQPPMHRSDSIVIDEYAERIKEMNKILQSSVPTSPPMFN